MGGDERKSGDDNANDQSRHEGQRRGAQVEVDYLGFLQSVVHLEGHS